MKKTLIIFLMLMTAMFGLGTGPVVAGKVKAISGAGATFPYPVYAKWAAAYYKLTGIKLNYQSIGSGGGIKQIKAKTVDFGASDAPLKPEQLDKWGLMQFPMIMGGVVPVVNLPGVKPGQLRLSNETLADIYLGKIRKWNDPAIQKDNPGMALPSKIITVVHRADGSGTTWIFTNFLCKVSEEWKKKVGNAKSVAWPTGIGGKGNEGVASYVKRIPGSIGYVEYAYALQNRLIYLKLKNRAGAYVEPNIDTFQAAAANADWAGAKGFYVVLTDQPGKDSWPITGASFILMHKIQDKPEVAKAVLTFFDWCYKNGQEMAKKLDYVPMPENVVELVEKAWATEIKDKSGNPIWP
ncbi:MAG: phosphate ABC transporter substrate-binding protein PstS [Thermodesulfobacteria bacterium]|nr:phosphate ABC transporter substrate-binding protein PstS [Thermodesulfobacteriota bacterium]